MVMEDTDVGISDQHDMAVSMVRYLLNQSISKTPIKRADMVTHCLRGNVKLFAGAYEKAAEILKKNYGMCIYKVDGVKTGQHFICVSKHANPCPRGLSAEEEKTLPVLFLVLAYIFMKGGQLTDHAVLAFLDKCDVGTENVDHPLFGDVRKLVLDVFVRQLYLKKTKLTLESSNEVRIQLEWGQRAELEFSRKDVLNAVAGLMKRPASSFVQQYEEVRVAAEGEDGEDEAMEQGGPQEAAERGEDDD